MSPAARLIVSALIRLALIFFAGWFALADAALHPDAHLVSRLGLALLFLIASVLVGEVATLRMHASLVIAALQAARGGAGGAAAAAMAQVAGAVDSPAAPDPTAAIPILIRTLESGDADTREKAWAHLKRLTGQDLPADPAAWKAWAAEQSG